MNAPGDTIVFFDSHCLLCDRAVQWLVRLDPEKRLQFAPLGGETFTRLNEEGAGLEEFEAKQTVVLARRENGGRWNLSARSDAVIGALEVAGSAPKRVALLRVIPQPIRNLGYRIVAALRYHLFGKVEVCSLAGGEEGRSRLLP